MAWCEGYSGTEVSRKRAKAGTEKWLTLDQLASSQYLANQQHAEWVVEANILKSQPHEIPFLAEKGVIQYLWNDKWKNLEDAVREFAGPRQRARSRGRT